MAGTSIGRMFVELGLEDSDFTGGMKNAEKSVGQLQAMGTSIAGVLDKTVTAAFASATAAVAGLTAATAAVGAGFQQALTTVGAVSDATAGEMEALEGKARSLGAATEFTAEQAATAMQDFARAGMTANQIVNASGPALLLAGSAGAEMSQATALMAGTLAQFNLEAVESTRISDVYSTALRKSLFDMSSLTEAMKYAGTVGAGFGMSLEETTAAVAQFRDLGLEGSMAGTNFRMAMAKATKVTEEGQKALARYNLTARDVNPELNTFAEIMEKVGKAGITTTDALEVFGNRAGANIAQIARGFADGSTTFYTLLDDLEDSAGSTEAMYERMGQTVQYQATVVASALSELMISVFDTFQGPLQELLAELSSTIAYVANYFNRQAGTIGRSFDDTIGKAVEYLRNNRAEIATTFVGLVNGVREATEALASMLPTLVSIGQGMVAIWVVNKVRQFAAGVQGAITMLTALNGNLRAIAATVTVMTGGIYALVAAVGAAVAIVAAWAVSLNEAERAAQRLRDAESALEADRQQREAAAAAAAAQLNEGMSERLGNVQAQLQAEGSLTESLEAHLGALGRLSDAQVQAGLASGQLFQATINGQQVVLDATTALELQWEATSVAEDVTRSFESAQRSNAQQQARTQEQLNNLNGALQEYQQHVDRGTNESQAFMGVLGRYGSTLEDVRAKVEGYEEQLGSLQAQEAGLSEQRTLALQELTRTETRAANATGQSTAAQREAMKAADEREAAERALQRAIEKRMDAERAVQEELELIGLQGAEREEVLLQRRLAAMSQLFDDEIAAAREAGVVLADIEEQRQQALELVRRTHTARLLDEQARVELAETQRIDSMITQLRQEAARNRATTLEAIDLERLQALREAEAGNVDQLVAINQHYDDKRAAARAALSAEIDALTSDENARVVQLTQERDRLLAQLDADMVDERTAVLEYYGAKIAEVTEQAADAGEEETGRLGEAFGAMADRAMAAGEKVWDAMQQLVGSVAGLLQTITGFDFDIMGAVDGIVDAQEEAQALADKLASGELSPQEYMEAMAELPRSAAEGAAAYVDELVAGAVTLVQTLIEALPVLIQRLAAAVPELMQALLAGMPQLVDALVATLPTLVQQLAAYLPALTATIAAAIPELVQLLIDQLPAVLDAIAASTPIIFEAITQAIAMLVAAIPELVQQLLGYLPTMITMLVESLGVVVQALVEAIPQLVQVVIEQLPTIVAALATGLMDALVMLVQSLAGDLLPTLIGMVPEIVSALMGAVTILVQAVVAQLPTLVEALLLAVVDIMLAVLEMVPDLIVAIVEMLPELLAAVVALIPAVIQGVVAALPQIIQALVDAMPDIVVAVVTELIPALILAIPDIVVSLLSFIPEAVVILWEEVFKGIGEFVSRIWDKVSGWFGGVGETVSEGASKVGEWAKGVWDKVTFWNDTPGMQQVGGLSRAMASFAPGDYVVAAQNPRDLVAQALAGFNGGLQGAQVQVPGMQSLAAAMLQATEAFAGAGGTGGAGSMDLKVTLQADGQVLDEVLYRAGQRGRAPHMAAAQHKSEVVAGVHRGFNRGKFQK